MLVVELLLLTADFAIAVAVARELNRQQSLAAVSLSDLIDTALQVYGIPTTAVKRITGTRNTLSLAPFFARELHPDSVDGGHLMLIGDAAMRVISSNQNLTRKFEIVAVLSACACSGCILLHPSSLAYLLAAITCRQKHLQHPSVVVCTGVLLQHAAPDRG